MAVDQALRARGVGTAAHADREQLIHLLGHREQPRHGRERRGAEILIEAGDDYALAAIRQCLADRQRGIGVIIKEVQFVQRDDLDIILRLFEHLAHGFDRVGLDPHAVVADQVADSVACIAVRGEGAQLLARDLDVVQAADQLLGLAAEHAAADHFDPAA